MRVDDDDCDDDGGDDKHHGEQHVLPDERNSAGGGRDELHDNQQEDSQRQQDGDGQGHLLACTGGHRSWCFKLDQHFYLDIFPTLSSSVIEPHSGGGGE